MKVYILKNRTTGAVANVIAECRTQAKNYVIQEKGWGEEQVFLKDERLILPPMEIPEATK